MAGRGSLRSTSQIFFVYDHTVLQKEEDDLKDAIIYFSPASVEDDDQCALCGQLMGMVGFFQSTWGAKPRSYQLATQKFVLTHIEDRYTLALGADNSVSDHCLEQQLKLLYDTFTMYMGSLGSIRQLAEKANYCPEMIGRCCANQRISSLQVVSNECNFQKALSFILWIYGSPLVTKNEIGQDCEDRQVSFSDSLQPIWECFLPFCCAYGDGVRRGFFSLPTIDLPKCGADVFLQASCMLQASKRRPGVLGGAVLSSNGVLCTQLSEELTSRFLVIKPQQNHLPCRQVKTDFLLPGGVRIINVLISQEEYLKLLHHPQSSTRHKSRSQFKPRCKTLSHDPPSYAITVGHSPFLSDQQQQQQQTCVSNRVEEFTSQTKSGIQLDSLSSLACQTKDRTDNFGPRGDGNSHSSPEHSKHDNIGQVSGDFVSKSNRSYSAVDDSSEDEDRFQGRERSISQVVLADVHVDSYSSEQNVSSQQASLDTLTGDSTVSDHLVSPCVEETSSGDNIGDQMVSGNNVNKIEDACMCSDVLMLPKEPDEEKVCSTESEVCDAVEKLESVKLEDEKILENSGKEVEPKCDEDLSSCEAHIDKIPQNSESQFQELPVHSDVCVPSSPETKQKSLSETDDSQTTNSVTEYSRETEQSNISGGQHSGITSVISSTEKIETKSCDVVFVDNYNVPDTQETEISDLLGETFSFGTTDSAISVSEDHIRDESVADPPGRETTFQDIEEGQVGSEVPSAYFHDDSNQGDERNFHVSSSEASSHIEGKETFIFSTQSSEPGPSDSSEGLTNRLAAQTVPQNQNPTVSMPSVSKQNSETLQNLRTDGHRNPGVSDLNPHGNGVKHLTLYIQGHSDSMMILLLEKEAGVDQETILALWKLALPQLGDLDFRVKELVEMESPKPAYEDYHYLMFNDFQRQVSGNVTKPVTGSEFEFCDLSIDLHEEFRQSPSLSELSARTHRASIYAHRNVNHEVFFQSTNRFRQPAGLPHDKDVLFALGHLATKKLYKNHNITLV